MSWMNSDGLFVKFSKEEGQVALGGDLRNDGGIQIIEVDIPYSEVVSATDAIVGAIGSPGARGVLVPKSARIIAIETIVTTAFTSSGTIGTSTLVMGLKKASDRSTELDHNGFTTTSFASTSADLDVVGARKYVTIGSTGAGALIGTSLSEDGILSASNSQHASHPFTAGVLKVRIHFTWL